MIKNTLQDSIPFVTGIDIGETAIKLVTLKRGPAGRIQLVRTTVQPFERSREDEEDSARRKRLVEALQQAVQAHEVPMGRVAIALPREKTTLRYAQLPSVVPDEVEEMLMFDAERHVPFPLADLELSFSIIKQTEENSTVKFAAAPSEQIEDLIEIFEEADIEVQVVDVDILAGCACYRFDREDTTPVRAIVDIGRRKIDLGVLRENRVYFSRTFPLKSNGQFVQDSEGHASGAASEWVDEVVGDLHRLLHAYECLPGMEEITEIVLCGGLSQMEGLEERIAHSLQRRVRSSPPELEGIEEIDGQIGPHLTVACGLAIRNLDAPEINLLPESVVRRRQATRQKRLARNISIFVFLILLLAGGVIGAKFQAKMQHLNSLQEALSQVRPKIADVQRKKAELTEISHNIDTENSFYKILQDLYLRTPENVMYTNIIFEKKKTLELVGKTSTREEVYNLRELLSNSPHFQDVVLNSDKLSHLFKTPAVEFNLSCILVSNDEYRPSRRRDR